MISASSIIFLSFARKALSVKPDTGILAFLLKLPLLRSEKLDDPEEREQEEMLAFLTLLHLVFSRLLAFTTGSLERSLMDQESLLADPR